MKRAPTPEEAADQRLLESLLRRSPEQASALLQERAAITSLCRSIVRSIYGDDAPPPRRRGAK